MPDPSLMELHGAQVSDKFRPLATVKFIGGLQTQRSPFASIDTRYNSRFLGGKPDALIDGSNVEISNSLTLQRRFGLSSFGSTSIPAPLAFYEYKQASPPSLQTIVDTATAVYIYQPTGSAILFYKSPGAGQTNFWTVGNTLYMTDGIDQFKYTGPNLLGQSNTFTDASFWFLNTNPAGVVTNQFDPNGGSKATQITWSAIDRNVFQVFTPAYTPAASNTFTASIWLRANNGSPQQLLKIIDNVSGAVIASATVALTQTWTRYSITGTASAAVVQLCFILQQSSGLNPIQIYGAQLELGTIATPTQITGPQPQGVSLWGIVAPTVAPSVSATALSAYWQATHAYNVGDSITDANGNLETVTVAGTSGGTVPTWPLLPNTTTTDGGVTWVQGGPNGLSPKTGYKWLFAYLNQTTGQPSNVSSFSVSTSTFSNNLGIAYTIAGPGSLDPQVNQIAVYRNADGGAFWFQVSTFANPANGGLWTFVDTVQDTNLSTIYAPIGLLNSPPPAGAINPVWHQSRMWISVGNNLYFSAGPDNASLLNIVQNGVIAESFALANVIPLDQQIIRSWSITAGLMVWTVGDLWLITGSDLASFNPVRILPGHGIRSYNSIDSDGSTTWMHTSDKQFLTLNASAGSVETGFTIGDKITANFDPSKSYVARHVGGSIDNAIFLADGSTGWFRVNPNQVGASVSGEPQAVWSPFATITNGAQAVASVETSPGVHQLLVGAPNNSTGTLTLGQLTGTGANSGSGTAWTNPNNVTLGNPASPATVQLNVQGSPGGKDVSGGATGSSTSPSTGSVTTTANNELDITVVAGTGPTLATTVTAGGGWTLDNQFSDIYREVITNVGHGGDPIETDYYFVFGAEHQNQAVAGAVTGTATLSRSNSWSAAIATFKSGSGAAPTIVQQKSAADSFGNEGAQFKSIAVQLTSAVAQGNFLVVAVGTSGLASALTVTDSLGNVFTAVQTTSKVAIFLAPISSVAGTDTVTLTSSSNVGALAMNIYEITLPPSAGTLSSKFLQATNYGLNVPNNNILGVKVFVTGSQSSSNPDAMLTLSWISPVGFSPSYTFQLPTSSGTVSFGSIASNWGQTLTATLLNNSAFGFQLQASVATSPNVTFNVSSVKVQVFYLNSPIQTFQVLFRDPTVFSDNGSSFTWSAVIGSLPLASSGTLAEVESITTETRAASGVQPAVSVLLDEISGSFESLPNSVNDPPQLAPSSSVLSNRFYLAQGPTPPLCKHLQIKLSGGATATRDELLGLTVRGALVPEQG